MNGQLKKRDIEQRLARELHQAREAYRLAMNRRQDLAMPDASKNILGPDSDLQLAQAIAECDRARQAFESSLQRWKRFVLAGEDPDQSS